MTPESETERMSRMMREMDEEKAARIAELHKQIEKALDEGREFRNLVNELNRLRESPCANN